MFFLRHPCLLRQQRGGSGAMLRSAFMPSRSSEISGAERNAARCRDSVNGSA